jgi:phage terminase large subunit GpA-like protein
MIATVPAATSPAAEEFRWLVRAARAPKLRSMLEFACQEIVIPTGPYMGRKFNPGRQPFARLYLEALDSGKWQHINLTGLSQSGKSLLGHVLPACYHLFEIGETVICGIPDMDMADDKWRRDFLPAIERTRYAALLPDRGEGSQGGRVKNGVHFKNGAMLKFMSAGGSDKSRAGFTARVLLVTETDEFGTIGETSMEANKLEQLFARTRAFGSRRRIYTECTVSIETFPTWRFHKLGTESTICCCCVHCGLWITPERPHLRGWQEAETVVDARLAAAFCCPACGQDFSDEQRRRMNERAVLIHRGQHAAGPPERPRIVGEPPRTDILGFRWSAFNNLFLTAGDCAAEEWKGARDPDEDNADRHLSQFLWALPYRPPITDTYVLDAHSLAARIGPWQRGYVPPDTLALTVGVDLGKRLGHYVVIAWQEGFAGCVVDYGVFEVAGDTLVVEKAIVLALRDFRERMEAGFPVLGERGEETDQRRSPDAVWIDSQYAQTAVFEFIREPLTDNRRWRPTQGVGAGQFLGTRYSQPRTKTSLIVKIGQGYHFARRPAHRATVVEISSDHWKSEVHSRLSVPYERGAAAHPGALVLFGGKEYAPKEHFQIAKHWTAEKQVTEFVPGKGEQVKWTREGTRPNHLLDASYLATAAAWDCGLRTLEAAAPVHGPAEVGTPLRLPDGRAYFVGERE